jgi:hypothetical protein
MSAVLDYKIDGNRLLLAGRIDENADLSRQADALLAEVTEIDLSGLTRINSIGVREWMDFTTSFAGKNLRLVRCAPVFVDQLNAIANFAGGAQVVSVMSAFECENDGEVRLLEVSTDAARRGELPTAPACPRCKGTMVVATDDGSFYRFLKYTR